MKKTILLLGVLCLLLTGCADEYRVTTVVYIPVSPTEAPEQSEEMLPQETQRPAETESIPEETVPEMTETATEETEEVPETTAPEKKKGNSKKKNPKKETEPPATEPPATEPPATKPPATEPTATEPVVTEPPATEPTVTEPAVTEPPVTEPPATEAPETEPAATEPPATEPAATEPPETEPPMTEPPVTEPPATEPEETEPESTEAELYDISGYSLSSLEKSMAAAINAYRAEEGAGELSLSSTLSAIASCRGYEISQVWSHTRPDGRDYRTVLSDYGYGGSAQELLVYVSGSGDAQSIVDKWMASDSHRELLLGAGSTVGIGIYRANGYTYIACLLV